MDQGGAGGSGTQAQYAVRIATGIGAFTEQEWESLGGTMPAASETDYNPFLSFAFLTSLEDSGCAVRATGWQGQHLRLEAPDSRLLGAAPCYVKSHSQGEYVFDHGWADAFERAGGRYYPKLQFAVPFSPVPGPRLLLRDPAAAAPLITAMEMVTQQNELSSAHATFIDPAQLPLFEQAGWLIRIGQQFHWSNAGYGSFDDFLGDFQSRKRKAVRKERAQALADGLRVEWITGDQLTEAHWDVFWDFYQDTGARKWGRPYLTRAFFSLLGETMADKVLLMFACRGGTPIAGALNLIGADTLYGRYWGCVEDVPFLHFELCYYQAIDYAIAHGLKRVEAGAQGEHKLARGYRPTPVYSAHYLPNPSFHRAVADYLEAERTAMTREIDALDEMSPFRNA